MAGEGYGFTNHGGPPGSERPMPFQRQGPPAYDRNGPPGIREEIERRQLDRRDPRPSQDLESQRSAIDNELNRRDMESKSQKARADYERLKAEGDRKIADAKAKHDQLRQAYEQKYGPDRPRTPIGSPGVSRSFSSPAMMLASIMGGDQAQGLQQFRQSQGTKDPAESDPLWTQLLNLLSRTR